MFDFQLWAERYLSKWRARQLVVALGLVLLAVAGFDIARAAFQTPVHVEKNATIKQWLNRHDSRAFLTTNDLVADAGDEFYDVVWVSGSPIINAMPSAICSRSAS